MKIGVILCDCGGQISGQIDVEALKRRILQDKGVSWFEVVGLACSEENKDKLINLIGDQPVDGLIILGCTPHLKGQYLQDTLKEIGVNPYLINIVNIREQVIWVTNNKEYALKKIYALFKGALNRLSHQKPLAEREISICPDVMVVGAGIAGITASITLSRLGRRVYLVEKQGFLGGRISDFETLFPNLQCAPCIIHPMIDDVLNDKNIELMTNAEVLSIRGGFGCLFVRLNLNPNYINPKKCVGCYACLEVCPVSCISIDPKKLPIIANIDETKCIKLHGQDCNACKGVCPVDGAIDFEVERNSKEFNVGAIIWSTGFEIFDCSKIDNLGYGRLPNIYTSTEFEEILHSEGKKKGEILTEQGKKPRKITIIHCVGSLDDNYHSHCSKICCQYAFKFNRLIRQKLPRVSIIHLIKELVLPGINANSLYLKARNDKKTLLIRFKSIKDIKIKKQGQNLSIRVNKDEILSDIVILCPAILKGNTTDNENAGIILCGSVKEPMSFEETTTDALAEVSRLQTLLKYDNKIKKSLHFAKLDYNKCSKCGLCLTQCPYGAIDLKEGNVPEISDVLCEGCGACAVSCPSKAIDIEGFTNEQIISEIGGIIEGLKEGEDWH